jgi:uncharacterized membrane protein (TIGR02234 family)
VTDPARGRRELVLGVVGCALAGGLALSSSGQAWLRVTAVRPAPLPPVHGVLTGSAAAPLVPATGLLLLAAGLALVAVRGAGRVAVGLLAAVGGGVLIWSGLRPLVGGLRVDAADLPPGAGVAGDRVDVAVSAGWPVVALVAGLLGAAAGLFVVLRGRGWPAMGRRYERAGAPATASRRPQTAEDRAQAAWKALDRGEDPTEEDPGAPTR